MQLFVIRHGEAQMHAPSDAQRELTAFGQAQLIKQGQHLARQITRLDYALVSPYIRAQQSWQHLAAQLPPCERVIELRELTPNGDEKAVAALIEELAYEQSDAVMLVVSHLPLVGYLVSTLCPESSPPLFSTASVAHLEIGENSAFLGMQHANEL